MFFSFLCFTSCDILSLFRAKRPRHTEPAQKRRRTTSHKQISVYIIANQNIRIHKPSPPRIIIAKQGMRRIDNSMHRKSSRLLKNIVILSIENPQSHTDNARKYGAQKIADTLCTRMLGKSPVCQNSGVGKKGEMLESCQQRQQRGKKQISNRRQKNSFQPMLFARLARRTREHQPERIACLGIEPSGSRTHDRLLRSGVVHLPFVSPGVPRNADIARIFPVPNPVRYPCCTVLIRPFSG